MCPPHGSPAFHRTASRCVFRTVSPFWTISVVRRELVGRRLVVGGVQRSAPGACGGFGRAFGTPTARDEQCRQAEDRDQPHRGSLPPVDFELTPEQREIQAVARELAAAEIEPYAAEWDRAHGFPRELLAKLAEPGLLGVCVPEEHGGAGADFMSYILVLEELSRADAGVGVTVAVHTSACTLPILAFGTDAQIAEFVPALAGGEHDRLLRADRARVRIRRRLADHVGGGDGRRLARAGSEAVDHERRVRRPAASLRTHRPGHAIRTRRVGVHRRRLAGRDHARPRRSSGLNSSVTNDIAIDTVIASDRLIGELNHGFRIAMATLDGGRIGIAAQAVGIAQAAYDVARRYALERETFGHRIADYQAIQHKLANMSMEIDAARLLVLRAAWLKDEGRPHTEAGAKAKLFASEMARRQTAEAIQVLGGYGYTKEFPVERYYRDAKITEIYEGTSEIQRLVIARSILGRQELIATPS